ncbi:MAG: 3-methyl-2-oxobutanoate dehydrogenase subunit VorB [Chloroflexi bacterium]|nr:3-methyl-2-oxobutanoate dehydrogenase subunit VorB [Chloroflexota bacterium]
MTKELWKGNEAIAESALRAGMEAYFGYPITPQTELLEYLAKKMPEMGRAFIQAESEVAAINMVYGAASGGARVMSSSSSPGMSLMQEGVSYIVGSEVPAVLVDIMRGGPGLGNIAPTQSDYFQLTKGGGHGDYRPIVLAPASVQEAVDLVYGSFDLAERYRHVVIVAADGNIGQMMEPVILPPPRQIEKRDRGWELNGAAGRERRIIVSIYLQPEVLHRHNEKIQAKQREMEKNEVRYQEYLLDDAEFAIVAFGTAARVAQSAVRWARAQGIRVGLFRPISLYPFPLARLGAIAKRVRAILVVEMSAGQMLEDVQLATNNIVPISFYGTMGGVVPFPDDLMPEIEKMIQATDCVRPRNYVGWVE